jgi:hypothetical protein
MSFASPRIKKMTLNAEVGDHFIYPIKGFPLPYGDPRDPENNYDPDNIYTPPSASSVGGLNLASLDYDPFYQFRGFIVMGNQTTSIVMVVFVNGSIGRFDNITIADGQGWTQVQGISLKMILSRGSGTTATGVHPII